MYSSTTKENASNTIADAKSTLYSAKRDLNDNTVSLREDISHLASNAGRQVRQLIDNARDEFSDASSRVTDEVRANPVRSSAIALGAGILLGLLIRR